MNFLEVFIDGELKFLKFCPENVLQGQQTKNVTR